MSVPHETMRPLLDRGDFEALFVEHLGWDNPPSSSRTIVLPEDEIAAEQIASKRGVGVWRIDGIPPSIVRRRVDVEVSRRTRERLLVFVDDHQQLWLWPEQRASGSGYRLIEHRYHPGAQNEALLQRIGAAAFTVDEEASLTVMDVLARIRRSFSAEEVTKRFYREFKEKHDNLLGQIEGIDEPTLLSWYGSVLLNRLMFIYFLQKKGFLDGDREYLRNRLVMVRRHLGPDAFYGFFREFLLPLFHEGLGSHHHRYRDPDIAKLIGDVPYVNGGIFSPHSLEKAYKIDVPDRAFEEIFEFFDRYRWHLDERPSDDPNEINPDVLGYIFEQYVNQKEQGAYYTKEDVTGYMTSTSLIPAFLDRLGAGDDLWDLLRVDPDRYIPESVRYGVDEPLPDSISRGLDDPDQRRGWSEKAHPVYALPSETWWEVLDRRKHCSDLRVRLAEGRVNDVSAAITANLDLRTLVSDYLRMLDTAEEVERAYRTLTDLTVVDPTCGSGAFLFAALEILKELYEAMLERAEELSPPSGTVPLLEEVKSHPNRAYFILKTAVLNNLYGVDIMHEAGEIARLRLFLKLVAQLNHREELEPLPDLDFNIRTGNLLVGIADVEDARTRLGTDLFGLAKLDEIEGAADEVSKLYEEFIASQRKVTDPEETEELKAVVAVSLGELRQDLDKFLYEARGESQGLADWVETHQPFHWFVEFPSVFRKGGFDVIVGNPPYIPRRNVSQYKINGYRTSELPDIYAVCVERSLHLLRDGGRFAMVLPHSISFSGRFKKAREVVESRLQRLWVSSYARIPAGLFSADTRVRNSIVIGATNGSGELFTTSCRRWTEAYRPHLMSTLRYAAPPMELRRAQWPFLMSDRIGAAFAALVANGSTIKDSLLPPYADRQAFSEWDDILFYKQTAYNWLAVFSTPPPAYDSKGNSVGQSKMGALRFVDGLTRDAALAALAGKWGFVWWCLFGDDFDVTESLLTSFPADTYTLAECDAVLQLVNELKRRMPDHIVYKVNAGKKVGNYHLGQMRDLTDAIDRMLCELWGQDVFDELNTTYFSTIKSDFE